MLIEQLWNSDLPKTASSGIIPLWQHSLPNVPLTLESRLSWWILFLPCRDVAEHSRTRGRVWNLSVTLRSCLGKKLPANSQTRRRDADIVMNSCDLVRSRGLFCVDKNEETDPTDSRGCAKAGGFQINSIIRTPAASAHIFLTRNRDKLFLWSCLRLNSED